MVLEEVNEEEVLEEYGEVSFLRSNFSIGFFRAKSNRCTLNVVATALFHRNEMHCACLTSLYQDLITSGHETISMGRVSGFVNT